MEQKKELLNPNKKFQEVKQEINEIKDSKEDKLKTLRNEKFEKMWNNRFAVNENKSENSKTKKFSKTMRPKSMMNMKRLQEHNTINDQQESKTQNLQINKNPRENVRTARGGRPTTTGGKKYWKVNSIDDYGWSNNNVFANILRNPTSKKMNKNQHIKEIKWNQRFAIPISTYNY